MRFVWGILLKGLATILPITLTLYLIYWISTSMETLLHSVITNVIPNHTYIPGMGVATGLVLLFLIGLVVNAWFVRHTIDWSDRLLARIPLVKSIHSAIKDFTHFFSSSDQRSKQQKVVLVTINNIHLLGFMTRDQVDFVPDSTEEIVAVYLPMSYQIGGYTIYLPRSQVKPVDMTTEDAMREVLTAGLSKGSSRNKSSRTPSTNTPEKSHS
ncbi:MAG: DUF502 domain-containing protein [Gammaproteobacteria bacterium]|nr:DUF502 domain-containing protein [Gammaproteobacteria bacterium]